MTRTIAAPSTLLGAGLAAAFSLAAPAAPARPSHDEALRCWLMTHPNRERLRVTHWPAVEPRGEKVA